MAKKKPKSFLDKIGNASNQTEVQVKKKAQLPGELVAPGGAALRLHPGVERWAIKTGTDPEVNTVGKDGIVDTTVDELVKIPRPRDFVPPTSEVPAYENRRAAPVETTVWRLQADVIAIKLEADGDFHLVLQGDSGEQMIGEIPDPDPAFVNPSSPFAAHIKAARDAADQHLIQPHGPRATEMVGGMLVPPSTLVAFHGRSTGRPPKPGTAPFKTKVPATKVIVTGVGFFDRIHGQMGVAPLNGVELHPILSIEFPK